VTTAQDDLALANPGDPGPQLVRRGPFAVEPVIDALARDPELARRLAYAHAFDPVMQSHSAQSAPAGTHSAVLAEEIRKFVQR
jgi:hypothetical protein